MSDDLRLKKANANKYIDKLIKAVSNKYDIRIQKDNEIKIGDGSIRNSVVGNFYIKIGAGMRTMNKDSSKYIEDVDFLKCICAIYHEKQHIVQDCGKFYDSCPDEDIIMMSTRRLASQTNTSYYAKSSRYYNDLSEIDAEYVAIANTYDYIKEKFPKTNADYLISKMINDKIKNQPHYFISGHFETCDNILDAFSEHYEEVQRTPVDYYVFPRSPISNSDDDCMKFMKYCENNNLSPRFKDVQKVVDKFNNTTEPHEKDLLVASITCYIHPEIPYEKAYPCLKDIDLSPKAIFGMELPNFPDYFPYRFIEPLPIDKIKERVK